ncbi:MAG: GDP-mannose 4,6-dehydratase [Deltaproteobacteria bacterium]|nr:GDP-mannose 4,6-dehydratase [Deltaproteobacteria bacterium]
MKKAFITGVTGQDGSYLSEFLLDKDYEVHGVIRRTTSFKNEWLDEIFDNPKYKDKPFYLHYGDLTDAQGLIHLMQKIKPDEVYNLGSQSHVRMSFDIPEYTGDVTGLGNLRILDAIIETGSQARFYQASSSEMFGKAQETPQKETTPFYPRSPYACAKVFAFWSTVNYREAYHMHATNGILFNHESPRRGEAFVTRKITKGLARILAGKQKELYLGNLDAKRDWGFAKDYVEAMWLMLQQPQGDDYVVSTGETHSVKEFLELAFKTIGRDWQEFVKIDPINFRRTEVDALVGDHTKAKNKLGWKPTMSFRNLVLLMVREDIKKEGLNPDKFIRQ